MSAQKYCRESYTDLATVSSHVENKKINELTNKTSAWIGLFRDDKFSWSDGMSFQFSRWDNVGNLIGSMRIICGATSVKISVAWKFLSCETKLPFVCYSLPPGECFTDLQRHKMMHSIRKMVFSQMNCHLRIKLFSPSHLPLEVKRATKMMMESEDSAVLNKPALKANILKKVRLKCSVFISEGTEFTAQGWAGVLKILVEIF